MRWLRALGAVVAVALLLRPAAEPPAVAPPASAGRPAPVWDLLTLVRDDAARPAGRSVAMRHAWGEARTAVATRIPDALAYPARIPPAAVLDFAYAIEASGFFQEVPEEVPPARFRVAFRDDAGREHVLLDRVVDVRRRRRDRRWFDTRVDLGPLANATGTLVFGVAYLQPPERPPPALAVFAAPRILQAAPAGAPNVLLVTIDCLRADHVGAYGYSRPTSPAIDRLAREGIRFARAFTSAPMTLPSLPQLFTSTVFPAAADATWLAPFVAAGVPSAAIVNNLWLVLWQTLGRDPGVRDTFDRFVARESLDAREITDGAIAWLDGRPGTRFALYLHYLDAHSPYTLFPRRADVFGDPRYSGPVTQAFNDVGAPAARYTARDRQRVVDWYDGGIRWIDAQLGRLLDHLRADGRLDRTIVIVTADHGEELWDHGRFFHGQSLYDELLHVPLVVRLPDAAHAGTVVDRAVRTIDVAPALVDWAGLPAPPGFTGRRLADAIAHPDAPADDLVATATVSQWPTRYGLRTPQAKLVETVTTGTTTLFDLATDPRELHDVRAAEPAVAAALGSRLAAARRDLWHAGLELRVVGTGTLFRLRLHGPPSGGSFATLDRRGASAPRIALDQSARTLRVKGIAGTDPFALRFDWRPRPLADAAGRDPMTLTVESPESVDVRVGGEGRPLEAAEIDARDPGLEAAEEPRCPVPAGGVRVCLWRWPRAVAPPTPAAPDAATQQRLRSLGYVQ